MGFNQYGPVRAKWLLRFCTVQQADKSHQWLPLSTPSAPLHPTPPSYSHFFFCFICFGCSLALLTAHLGTRPHGVHSPTALQLFSHWMKNENIKIWFKMQFFFNCRMHGLNVNLELHFSSSLFSHL